MLIWQIVSSAVCSTCGSNQLPSPYVLSPQLTIFHYSLFQSLQQSQHIRRSSLSHTIDHLLKSNQDLRIASETAAAAVWRNNICLWSTTVKSVFCIFMTKSLIFHFSFSVWILKYEEQLSFSCASTFFLSALHTSTHPQRDRLKRTFFPRTYHLLVEASIPNDSFRLCLPLLSIGAFSDLQNSSELGYFPPWLLKIALDTICVVDF